MHLLMEGQAASDKRADRGGGGEGKEAYLLSVCFAKSSPSDSLHCLIIDFLFILQYFLGSQVVARYYKGLLALTTIITSIPKTANLNSERKIK